RAARIPSTEPPPLPLAPIPRRAVVLDRPPKEHAGLEAELRPRGVDLDPRPVRHTVEQAQERRLVLTQAGGVDVVEADVANEERAGGEDRRGEAEAELRRPVVVAEGPRALGARGGVLGRRRHSDDSCTASAYTSPTSTLELEREVESPLQ
ncbi:hypothetical protein THAOC_24020, partial [Thalassiosira oceanica]